MDTGKKLAEFRYACGMDKHDLALSANVDVRTITNIEQHGTGRARAGILQKIAACLDVYPRMLQSQDDISRRGVIEPLFEPQSRPYGCLFDDPEDFNDF